VTASSRVSRRFFGRSTRRADYSTNRPDSRLGWMARCSGYAGHPPLRQFCCRSISKRTLGSGSVPKVVSPTIFDPRFGERRIDTRNRIEPLARLLFRSSVRGHRSEIMFSVLVVVLRPYHIAGQGFSSGQREIPLIASSPLPRSQQEFAPGCTVQIRERGQSQA
jgi:hypothetical protein